MALVKFITFVGYYVKCEMYLHTTFFMFHGYVAILAVCFLVSYRIGKTRSPNQPLTELGVSVLAEQRRIILSWYLGTFVKVATAPDRRGLR